MLEFDENRFREQVNRALKSVKTVLDNTRCPQYAADVPHVYGMLSFLSFTTLTSR